MKRIATFSENGRLVGVVHGPDASDQSICVRGRVWRFDFDKRGGPHWLKANGEPRKNQCPTVKAVWDGFEKWRRRYEEEEAAALTSAL